MTRLIKALSALIVLLLPALAWAQTLSPIAGSASQYFPRPARIAAVGDSIGDILAGGLFTGGPLFWSQVRAPRLYDYQLTDNTGYSNPTQTTTGGHFSVSSSHSGTHTTYATACNLVNGTNACPDLFTPANVARVKAWAPDIMFLHSDGNDGGAVGTETFANTKAFIDAVNPPHTIILPALPRSVTAVQYQRYIMLLRQYERTNPGRIHVLWSAISQLTDETTSYGPVGGSSGAAGAFTSDGLHISANFGRAVEPELTRLLDQLGVPRISPRIPNQLDVYSSTEPGNNLFGTGGAFTGTYDSSFLTNFSGTRPATCSPGIGWVANGANAETAVTGSKSSFTYRGRTMTAWKISIAPTAALTADRTITVTCGYSIPSGTAYPVEFQIVTRVVNTTAGLLAVTAGSNGNINSIAGASFEMGKPYSTTSADLLPAGIDETWEVMLPGTIKFDASSFNYFTVRIYLKNGTQPAADIYLAALGAYRNTPLP